MFDVRCEAEIRNGSHKLHANTQWLFSYSGGVGVEDFILIYKGKSYARPWEFQKSMYKSPLKWVKLNMSIKYCFNETRNFHKIQKDGKL